MKHFLRITSVFIVMMSIFLLVQCKTLRSTQITILSTEDTFKQDMLESIMEFGNDSVPLDSQYIPYWLK